MLGILQRRGHPGDSAFEPPDAQFRMPVEDAREDVLGELFAERVDVDHHADHDAVVLARSLGRGLADVVGDRHAGVFDLVPDRVHRRGAVVVDVAVVVLARVEWQQERLEPERLQLRELAGGCPWGPTS